MAARILVVDDNRANLDLMLYLLRAFGYDADGRTDSGEGLKAACGGTYDIVLSDIFMPVMDGYEFARRFKSDVPLGTTTLVAVTALAMVGDKERILEAGFDGYISKPIDPQTFVASVENYLPGARDRGNDSSR